jgi:hypothetical protein
MIPHAISAFPSEISPPERAEGEGRPTPRQELLAARLLCRGEPLTLAARMAGIRPEMLDELCREPAFRRLQEDCEAEQAQSAEERRTRLEGLFHLALEQGLAEGRVGAIAAAMRLLGLAPRGGGGGGRQRAKEDGDGPEPEPPSGERWGLAYDEEQGWVTPDGREAMPGRELEIVEAPKGPVRCLETVGFVDLSPPYLDFLDGLDLKTTQEINQLAYSDAGPQWDPVTRTLW